MARWTRSIYNNPTNNISSKTLLIIIIGKNLNDNKNVMIRNGICYFKNAYLILYHQGHTGIISTNLKSKLRHFGKLINNHYGQSWLEYCKNGWPSRWNIILVLEYHECNFYKHYFN